MVGAGDSATDADGVALGSAAIALMHIATLNNAHKVPLAFIVHHCTDASRRNGDSEEEIGNCKV